MHIKLLLAGAALIIGSAGVYVTCVGILAPDAPPAVQPRPDLPASSTYNGYVFEDLGMGLDIAQASTIGPETKVIGVRAGKHILTVRMPCGRIWTLSAGDPVPTTDIPCPCGNPNHMIWTVSTP